MSHKPFYHKPAEIPLLLSGRQTAIVRPWKRQPEGKVHRILQNKIHPEFFFLDADYPGAVCESSPFGIPGTVLWGKESYGETEGNFNGDPSERYVYKVDTDRCGQIFLPSLSLFATFKGEWISPALMPKSACRLWLKVKKVKVIRVQEVTHEMAKKIHNNPMPHRDEQSGVEDSYRDAFRHFWNRDYGDKGMSWGANPYIWYCEVELIDKPENA